jgi:hypothetical protein
MKKNARENRHGSPYRPGGSMKVVLLAEKRMENKLLAADFGAARLPLHQDF